MSGRSPLSTTTGPSVTCAASMATRVACPVPRRSVCSTHSTSVSEADDHDDAVGPGVARRARDPRDERAIEQFVHYLGVTGLHARTLAGGENDRGHGHGCASKSEVCLSQKIPLTIITQPFDRLERFRAALYGMRKIRRILAERYSLRSLEVAGGAGLLVQWRTHRGIVQWLGQWFLVPSMWVRILLPLPSARMRAARHRRAAFFARARHGR